MFCKFNSIKFLKIYRYRDLIFKSNLKLIVFLFCFLFVFFKRKKDSAYLTTILCENNMTFKLVLTQQNEKFLMNYKETRTKMMVMVMLLCRFVLKQQMM